MGWLVPSEIHDLNTRSAGQSVTVFTQLMSGCACHLLSAQQWLFCITSCLPEQQLLSSSLHDLADKHSRLAGPL